MFSDIDTNKKTKHFLICVKTSFESENKKLKDGVSVSLDIFSQRSGRKLKSSFLYLEILFKREIDKKAIGNKNVLGFVSTEF